MDNAGDNYKRLFVILNRIEEKIDYLTDYERDRILYDFYRNVIADYDGELSFLATTDERVHTYFLKIRDRILKRERSKWE